jgi:hypothetical protein
MPAKIKRALTVPEGATHFTLERHYRDDKDKERRKPLKGAPREDGSVPSMWDAGDFSIPNVLKMFGEGKYRVDFYDAMGAHITPSGGVFEVAAPPAAPRLKKGKREREARELEEEDDDAPQARALPAPQRRAFERAARGEFTIMDLLALQEQQRREATEMAERRAERERADADQRRQSDRDFMQTMMQIMKGGQPVDTELLRREMALAAKETRHELRHELRAQLAQAPPNPDPGDDDDDDDDDGPETVEEALDQAGGAILKDLAARAPHLIEHVLATLQQKGFVPSPEAQAKLAGVAAHMQPVNGAPRAPRA